MTKCALCQDVGWVCEEHPRAALAGPRACGCGAAGMPCSRCNVPEDGEAPRVPDGFDIDDGTGGFIECDLQ